MAETLRILQEPDDRLRQVCQAIDEITDEHLAYIQKMKNTLKKSGGVGLAAPQVGILDRVALVRFEKGKKYTSPLVIINPKILSFSDEQSVAEEGCLSIDDFTADIPRYNTIEVEYMDEHGNEHQRKLTDFNARVVQHEIDHLNGVLITDRMIEKAIF
jgi:peptide deformylase